MQIRPNTLIGRPSSLALLPFLLLPLAAQHQPKRATVVNSLVPAGAASSSKTAEPAEFEPPRETSNPYLKRPPMLIPKDSSAEVLSQTQKAVREAEKHFEYGKFCIQEGKTDEARREFDRAIDLLLEVPEGAPDRAAAEKRFEEMIRLIHHYDIESLGSAASQEAPVFVQSPLPEILDLTFPIDPSQKDKAVAQVAAASSQLPLVVNDAVLSYINYFTSARGQKVLYVGLKRMGRYHDLISRILEEEGVPQELIHLAQAESAFMPRAVSRARATGMWQFMKSRGAEYGLDATATFDERLDPEKATRAAARHLHDLYTLLGDWHLAMAAYNCGPLCVERAVQRTGYADFWELKSRNALPRETSNYVPAILAMAIVSKNLSAYGLPPVAADPALEVDTIRLTAPTSQALVADGLDLPVSEVRDLNPSLLKLVAPAGYEMCVPKGKGSMVLAALESVPEAKRNSWRLHTVAAGETLASISRRYSTTTASILAANSGLDASFFDSPERGQKLLIPAAAQPESVARKVAAKGRTGTQKYASGTTKSRQGSQTRIAATSTKSRKPVSR